MYIYIYIHTYIHTYIIHACTHISLTRYIYTHMCVCLFNLCLLINIICVSVCVYRKK